MTKRRRDHKGRLSAKDRGGPGPRAAAGAPRDVTEGGRLAVFPESSRRGRSNRRFGFTGVTGRLWISMVAFVLIVMLPVSMALDRGLRSLYVRYTTDELLDVGYRFSEFLSRAPEGDAAAAVRAIADISGTSLLVIDETGVVVTGSPLLAAEIGQRLANPRILEVLSGQPQAFLTEDPSLFGHLFVAAVPITRTGGTLPAEGAVVLFRSATTVERTMTTVRRTVVAATVMLAALLSVLAWMLSRWLARPLLEMRDAAHRMAAGDYNVRVKGRGADELGDLAWAINDLGQSLQTHEQGRRAFFANVSHELRTPLSYIQGYADLLADGMAASDAEVGRYGGILAEESRRLSRLVDDLFVLARADEGELTLESTTVDVSALVASTMEKVAGRAKERDITMISQCDGAVTGWADALRLEQVLMNVVDNALRHTPEGGQIVLDCWLERARVEVADGADGVDAYNVSSRMRSEGSGRLYNGSYVMVTVEDSGPGFEPRPKGTAVPEGLDAPVASTGFTSVGDGHAGEEADYEVYLERFFRGDKSRNRHLGGTGMGLAIVRAIVEAGGGRVRLGRSHRLGGALVAFTVPAAKRA